MSRSKGMLLGSAKNFYRKTSRFSRGNEKPAERTLDAIRYLALTVARRFCSAIKRRMNTSCTKYTQ